MSFDQKCYELAEYFLLDNGAATVEHTAELAQILQDAAEDWHQPSEEYPDFGPTDPGETSGPNN